jgi:hypothetical protein
VFKVTAQPSVTIAAEAHIDFGGSGVECTALYVSGSISGLKFIFADKNSTVSVHDLTILTDDASGTKNGLILNNTAAGTPEVVGGSSVVNVNFRGFNSWVGGAVCGTEYWGNGVANQGVSDVKYDNVNVLGPCAGGGTGINLSGNAGSSGAYAVVHNIVNSSCYLSSVCVFYGDYIQGVSINSLNATGGTTGIATASSPVGTLDQLSLINSQFGVETSAAVNIQGAMNDVLLSNNYIITNGAGQVGVYAQGQRVMINGNSFYTTSIVSLSAIDVIGATAGIISNNYMQAYTTGVAIANATHNLQVNDNKGSLNTNDYGINASATGVVIEDLTPRAVASLPTCNASIVGAKMLVNNNATAISYRGAVTAGGTTLSPVICSNVGPAWLQN